MLIRLLLIGGLLFFPLITGFISLLAWLDLLRLLKKIKVIATTDDLEEMKPFVARQMYAALLALPTLILPALIYIAGLVLKILYAADILFLIVPSGLVILIAQIYKIFERRAQNFEVTDPALEEEYLHIVKVWNRKPFPDW